MGILLGLGMMYMLKKDKQEVENKDLFKDIKSLGAIHITHGGLIKFEQFVDVTNIISKHAK